MFGGAGLNFSGVRAAEQYLNSVQNIQQMSDIDVNIPNHEFNGDVFERYELLKDRQDGDPHPFVDPETFDAWMQQLQGMAEDKLAEEQAAAEN